MTAEQVARFDRPPGLASGFRHEALIYADAEEFLAVAVPFLRAALEAEEPACVAVSRRNVQLLEGELGPEAGEIRFEAIEEVGRNPARIIPFWREFVDAQQGRRSRGIGEPVWPGRGAAEIDECQRHEGLLNVAFTGRDNWSLLCPYDASNLSDEVLGQVSCSHRVVARGEERREPSRDFRDAPDAFAGELAGRPADAASFSFDRDALAEVRRRVERAAAEAGLGRRASADLVVAASELAANSVAHGGGGGVLHTWQEAGRLLVEFKDAGRIEEQLAGRLQPSIMQEGGRGLWLANQLCDLVQIRSGAMGTAVRLQAARA
jgi:anti-sigma regulatory factor (Ser/Thr protein kinase)